MMNWARECRVASGGRGVRVLLLLAAYALSGGVWTQSVRAQEVRPGLVLRQLTKDGKILY